MASRTFVTHLNGPAQHELVNTSDTRCVFSQPEAAKGVLLQQQRAPVAAAAAAMRVIAQATAARRT